MNSLQFLMKSADLISRQIPQLDDSELKQFVRPFWAVRSAYLSLAEAKGSPLYVIEADKLKARARRFQKVFSSALSEPRVFFALKSNSHPVVVNSLIAEGLGLDASSGIELSDALSYCAKDVVFSGPGKRWDELELAVANASRVTVLMDSFDEMRKLEEIAGLSKVSIRAGIRLTTDEFSIWRKFGIRLDRLQEFISEAQTCRWVDFRGLQFHISWNLNAESQVVFIARLSAELRKLSKKQRETIQFLDVGGGFWPEEGEWLQYAATPQGKVGGALDICQVSGLKHYKRAASPIDGFANHIATALRNLMPSDMNCTIYLEPGRWLCNNAMHILLTVVDVKGTDLVITDGGTNAVGWERFETDYCPIINLSRPSLLENECLVAGSLCTPHDIWGYSYFGETIREGDVLLVPDQGAYTYSLRQEFIKPIPRCAVLPRCEVEEYE